MSAPRVSEEIKESDSNMFEGMISIRAVLSTDCKNRRITKLLYSKERTEKKQARIQMAYLRSGKIRIYYRNSDAKRDR